MSPHLFCTVSNFDLSGRRGGCDFRFFEKKLGKKLPHKLFGGVAISSNKTVRILNEASLLSVLIIRSQVPELQVKINRLFCRESPPSRRLCRQVRVIHKRERMLKISKMRLVAFLKSRPSPSYAAFLWFVSCRRGQEMNKK